MGETAAPERLREICLRPDHRVSLALYALRQLRGAEGTAEARAQRDG